MNNILSDEEIENCKRYFGIGLAGGGGGSIEPLDVVARNLFSTLEKRTEERDEYKQTAIERKDRVRNLEKGHAEFIKVNEELKEENEKLKAQVEDLIDDRDGVIGKPLDRDFGEH